MNPITVCIFSSSQPPLGIIQCQTSLLQVTAFRTVLHLRGLLNQSKIHGHKEHFAPQTQLLFSIKQEKAHIFTSTHLLSPNTPNIYIYGLQLGTPVTLMAAGLDDEVKLEHLGSEMLSRTHCLRKVGEGGISKSPGYFRRLFCTTDPFIQPTCSLNYFIYLCMFKILHS